MTSREKQMLCGLFLSKFDQEGLASFGFGSFVEAFNALGYGLSARPASIKNYRDEFDPYFSNARKGWHKRPLRLHCKEMLDTFQESTIQEMASIIRAFMAPHAGIESLSDLGHILDLPARDESSPFAKRLVTGVAAENYFASNYKSIPEFERMDLTNTAMWGCGFDFKLSTSDGLPYRAVEVKGLRATSGQIQMTDLEHRVSEVLRERYYLVIVRNFEDRPFHTVIQDPLRSSLHFSPTKRQEVRLTWSASID